jgi:hypothetical protein
MKIGVIIFSFYLLALSTMPCADVSQVQIAKTHSVTASAKHQHNNDFCTPFCTCSCCGGIAFYQSITSLQISFLSIDVDQIASIATFVSHDFQFIWQPPKIS